MPANRTDLGACGGKSAALDWKAYGSSGIYVDVDTNDCTQLLYKKDVLKPGSVTQMTPHYFTSLGGSSNHWLTRGVTSIYNLNSYKFRVYLNYAGVTPEYAAERNWRVNWVLQP